MIIKDQSEGEIPAELRKLFKDIGMAFLAGLDDCAPWSRNTSPNFEKLEKFFLRSWWNLFHSI